MEQWQSEQWRPPSPYVTHQDMAPVHSRLGAVEHGQQATLDAYNHLRGDMLSGFDRLAKKIDETNRTEEPRQQSGLNITMPLLATIIAGAVLAGAALTNSPLLHSFLGAQ